MSKFAEKLRRVYKGSAPTLGFRKAGEAFPAQMLVVANLIGAGKMSKATTGADAIIVGSGSLTREGFEQLNKAVDDIPLGILLEGARQGNVDLDVAVCDFVVFDVKAPLALVAREGIGKILQIEPSLDVGLLRAVNELPFSVDGVLLAGEDSSITIERLLICQRFVDLLDKPLLVTVSSSVSNEELNSLCQTGVKAIVLSEKITGKALTELKKAVACMPKPTRRKASNIPVLPRVNLETGGVEEEEEEEEEEI